MKHRLLEISAAISLLLCVAICGLYIESFNSCERFYFATWSVDSVLHEVCVTGSESRVELSYDRTHLLTTSLSGIIRGANAPGLHHRSVDLTNLNRAGFDIFGRNYAWWSVGSDNRNGKAIVSSGWHVLVPAWALIPCLSILPVLWLIRKLRNLRQSKQGLCPACGYDLRATRDRCPECGTVPPPAVKDPT